MICIRIWAGICSAQQRQLVRSAVKYSQPDIGIMHVLPTQILVLNVKNSTMKCVASSTIHVRFLGCHDKDKDYTLKVQRVRFTTLYLQNIIF